MATTVQSWLDARSDRVPAALLERIRAAVASAETSGPDESGQSDSGALDRQVQAFMGIVIDQVSQIRRLPGDNRGDALDLLAADALMTYALEFVAEVKPEAMPRYAVELMRIAGGV